MLKAKQRNEADICLSLLTWLKKVKKTLPNYLGSVFLRLSYSRTIWPP